MPPHEGDRRRAVRVPAHPARAAVAAGLRYLTDDRPGIRRVRAGRSLRYLRPDGGAVRDAATLARIRTLAIPPAWTDVWICPDPRGHLQATGHDKRGRKQYRYHPSWRALRDESKYGRMLAFGRALPRIRARVDRDLSRPGLPRDRVIATLVRLLETTLIRVGNEEYARENGSFGLTTMREDHATVRGSSIRFWFKGKTGRRHDVGVRDRRLSRIVRRCQELPGQELFRYVDRSGRPRPVGSQDVNSYLRRVTGEEFTAKDFRTWAATVLAAWELWSLRSATKAPTKRNVTRAIEAVAARLGNTATICRKSYVHPAVIDTYLDGTLADTLEEKPREPSAPEGAELHERERAVLGLLYRRLGGADAARRDDQVRGAK